MPIADHVQGEGLGRRVELFQFDLSMFGEENIYLTPGDESAGLLHAATFDGQVYSPYPIKCEGFELSSTGPLARPILTLANASGILTGLIRANDYFRGALVTRLVTFEAFLDDGEDPDPEGILDTAVYIVRRPLGRTPRRAVVSFELGAPTDLVDSYVPARVMVRDFCDLSYRIYNAETEDFDYPEDGCPYAGEVYLDAQDQPCAKSEDDCSKRLTGGCKARFGATADLPFRGFPGIARYRVR